jgi:hypothetical protein
MPSQASGSIPAAPGSRHPALALGRYRIIGDLKMWSRLKSFCLNSLTIAWGYLLAFTGAVMQAVDTAADMLGDPNLKDQISQAIGDTKTVGRILLSISVITIAARLRSLRKVN